MVTRVIFPQERSQPQTPAGPPFRSLCMSVYPSEGGLHPRFGVGRDTDHAANTHERLIFQPWPGAARFPPPSQAGWRLDIWGSLK